MPSVRSSARNVSSRSGKRTPFTGSPPTPTQMLVPNPTVAQAVAGLVGQRAALRHHAERAGPQRHVGQEAELHLAGDREAGCRSADPQRAGVARHAADPQRVVNRHALRDRHEQLDAGADRVLRRGQHAVRRHHRERDLGAGRAPPPRGNRRTPACLRRCPRRRAPRRRRRCWCRIPSCGGRERCRCARWRLARSPVGARAADDVAASSGARQRDHARSCCLISRSLALAPGMTGGSRIASTRLSAASSDSSTAMSGRFAARIACASAKRLPTMRATTGTFSAGVRSSAMQSRLANSARSVMPAKMLTSTTRTLGRSAIQPSVLIRRVGSPRSRPVRISRKFNGLPPRVGHLVDQHHREAGAGGDQADLALLDRPRRSRSRR